eukprot:COSAG01_NODE_16568_length_1225_cov_0.673179_1_plen_62_part_00
MQAHWRLKIGSHSHGTLKTLRRGGHVAPQTMAERQHVPQLDLSILLPRQCLKRCHSFCPVA